MESEAGKEIQVQLLLMKNGWVLSCFLQGRPSAWKSFGSEAACRHILFFWPEVSGLHTRFGRQGCAPTEAASGQSRYEYSYYGSYVSS